MVARRLAKLPLTYLDNITSILDIGSWHLNQSIEFADIFSDARITAFEPVPESYAMCMDKLAKLESQKKARISVHNLALGNTKGEVPFYATDTSVNQKIDAGFSSLFKLTDNLRNGYYTGPLVQKEIKVNADTLDNWCKENKVKHVDIMWVDVQGAELLVFKGAEKILKNTRVIMTEVGLKPYYEGHTLKADIDTYLIGLGFRELHDTFELNGFDYEANTIYVNDALN